MHEGIDLGVLTAVAAAVAAWSLCSRFLDRWHVSAPIAFVAVGMVVANDPVSLVDLSPGSLAVRELAEITLALVLFGDAATVDVRELRRERWLTGRLLGIGLPLSMAAGTLAAHLLLGTSWWVSAVIGASVAPTDAALGAAILGDERVPARIRRLLNVESGLNDGIITPFVSFFLVAAVAGSTLERASEGRALWELLIGVLAGVGVGVVGGWATGVAQRRGLASPAHAAIGAAALAIFSYAWTLQLGGNGFVAAFVAGLAYGGTRVAGGGEPALEFAHQTGDLLSMIVWFTFGAVVPSLVGDAGWPELAFALAALTVVRMVPVAVALLGSGLDRTTVAVVGWFGPRGLASVVFALLALEALPTDDGRVVLTAIVVTVLLSVLAHGMTATWAGARMAAPDEVP